jgi:exosortase
MAQRPISEIAVATAGAAAEPGRAAAAVRSDRPASSVVVAMVCGVLALVYAPTALWLFDRWTMSVWHNAHGALVLPVAGWLVWQELKPTRHWGVSSSRLGWPIVIAALALHVLDQGMQTQLLSAVSFVVLLPGLSLLLLGRARTVRILFPLLFVALMLPIPLVITDRLTLILREIAAVATAWTMPLLGIPVMRVETTLYTPNASLLVADACSGFSTLYAAGAVALLTMYMSASTVRRVLVGVLFAPIAIAVNIVRVTLLGVLVYFQGTDVLATSLHELSGLVTFAIALPIIFWLGGPARPVETAGA